MTRRSDIKNDDGEYMYPDVLDGPEQESKPLSEMTEEELKAYAELIRTRLRIYDEHTHTDSGHIPDRRK